MSCLFVGKGGGLGGWPGVSETVSVSRSRLHGEVGQLARRKLVIVLCWKTRHNHQPLLVGFFLFAFLANFGDLFLTPSFAQEPHFFDNDEEFALGASHYASWREKFSQPVKPAENLGFLAAFELNAC